MNGNGFLYFTDVAHQIGHRTVGLTTLPGEEKGLLSLIILKMGRFPGWSLNLTYVPFPVCFGDFAGCESVIIHSFVGNFGICVLFSGAIIIESKNSWTRQQQRVAS